MQKDQLCHRGKFLKSFSISYMMNSPTEYLSNERSLFGDNSGVEPTILSMENRNFSLAIFMGNSSLRLSRVLLTNNFIIVRIQIETLLHSIWATVQGDFFLFLALRGLPSILSLFRNECNKFNNTRARMLDSIKTL